MAPSNLQGLNVVQLPQESSDSQDLLAYPDLSAQLDLWTNLTFDSDDHKQDDAKSASNTKEEVARSPITGEKAIRDGHVNVVTPTNVVVNQPHNTAAQPFDFNSFLAGFAIEHYAGQSSQLSQLPPITTSMAQLLALHSDRTLQSVSPQYSPSTRPSPSSDGSLVPAKRARIRKESTTTVHSPSHRDDSVDPSDTTTNFLTAAEDKRRRNTAASARFRLKKKEREAALEGKAKELETRVTELERECEGLRRENGWLKGLVVGVTGAAQGSNTSQGLTAGSLPPASMAPRTKRKRGETESI
jgi:Basic region leucine zipper